MTMQTISRTSLAVVAVLALSAGAWAGGKPPARSKTAAEQTSPSVPAPVGTANVPITAFEAERHGFEFTNRFSGDIIVDLPGFGRVDLGDSTYGLCGGMTFAALDTFRLDGTAPDQPTSPPAPGSSLRSYLYDRQMDSLRNDGWWAVNRLILWIRKPLHDQTVPNPLAAGGENVIERGLITLTERELKNKVLPELGQRRPVPLLLVKASGADLTNPAKAFSMNHQVLAIAAYRHGEEWDLDVYDPNYPDEKQTLHTGSRKQTRKGSSTTVSKYRGFYRTPYKVKRPAWVPSDARQASVLGAPLVKLGDPGGE